ncbi:MAG: MFS transporter [Gemmatimonadaceae bacterium]|nr:MFS transporter [Gemmatimonadaceae bacterium]
MAVVLGMSPWFSATVVAPAIVREWDATDTGGLWLTLAVQAGFVAGSLVSAVFLLSDRLRPQRLAAWSALGAAVGTALLALPAVQLETAVLLRLAIGAALAGVYPPGIKLAAGWTRQHRGLAIGALVAGTTLGSAVPHLLRLAVAPDEWRALQWLAASCALAGAALFTCVVREGPYQAPSAPFSARALGAVFANRGVVLATGGYLGHMWELYAMWSSIGLFWSAFGATHGLASPLTSTLAFATVGAGAAGCLWAGTVADRVGRSRVAMLAMAISGCCSLLIGPATSGPTLVVVAIAIVWGMSIVADSAQFSAAVTEFAPHDYVGTAVTVQTALGFLLTMVTIGLVPAWSATWGWRYAYMPLAIGPLLGMVAMWRLSTIEAARAHIGTPAAGGE